MRERAEKLLLSLTVSAITFLLFHEAVGFGFSNCDDVSYLLVHPEVKNGLSPEGVKWAFTYVGDAIWMPLTWMSYMLDYTLGHGFGGMHLVSNLVHALNAALLSLLLFRLFPRLNRLLVLLAALVWAVHPLRVESVVWLASRKDVLSTFFLLLALITWFGERKFPLLSFLFLSLGALAKPSVMVFPVFAIPIDLVIRRQAKPWWTYLAAILLSAAIAIEGGLAQNLGGAMDPLDWTPLWYRCLNAVAAISVYFGNFLLPVDLAPQCQLRYPSMPRVSLLGAVPMAVFAALLLGFARRTLHPALRELGSLKSPAELAGWFRRTVDAVPGPSIGILVFLVALVPFLGVVGFGYHAFADRFTILPAIGLSVFILSVLEDVRGPKRTLSAACALLAFVAFLGTMTVRQVSFWENDGRLYDHTVAVDGEGNTMALSIAASYYYEFEHDLEKTRTRLAKVLDRPDGLLLFGSLGHLYMESVCVAGDMKAADDCMGWLIKWLHHARRLHRERSGDLREGWSTEYLVADAMRLAFTPGMLDVAEERLRELQRTAPRHPAVRVLAYRIAERRGDAAEIAVRLKECADCEGDPYFANRWARDAKTPRP